MAQKIDYPNNGGGKPDGTNPRIETGAIQFGNDWKGLFVRGDNAMHLAMQINHLLSWIEKQPDTVEITMAVQELKWLKELIINEVIS